MTFLHNIYFHIWHWSFQQIQLAVWFGNIVAGVVTFAFASLFWPKARAAYKRFFLGHMADIHEKLDTHHEAMLAQAEGHHEQHMEILKKHHEDLIATVKPAPRKAPAAKKATPRKGTA